MVSQILPAKLKSVEHRNFVLPPAPRNSYEYDNAPNLPIKNIFFRTPGLHGASGCAMIEFLQHMRKEQRLYGSRIQKFVRHA